ncbi:Cerato-ulmin hydrophobin family [Xylariaceae sp. FL0804]|nr:Cerato-ulmin hydrophobin family [Xylariaceae sp. FL0804]
MQFSAVVLAIFATAAAATPAKRSYKPCSGTLETTAQCCSTNVLGVADLDCETPPKVPTSGPEFKEICAALGKEPECCLLPVLGQALVCDTPEGLN